MAAKLARLPLAGIAREYPNAPQLVLNGSGDLKTPRELHPAFFGCFDWHSAVHGHWALVRLLRSGMLEVEHEVRHALAVNLTPEHLEAEADYFRRPDRASFERMYGWAWLLALAGELRTWDDPQGFEWASAIAPLEEIIVDSILSYLPKLTYPIRVGTHNNTAFALLMIWDYARAIGGRELLELVDSRARQYFYGDADYPAHLEPGGADFLSPALVEADLMRRVLSVTDFRVWLGRFLTGLPEGAPAALFTAAQVSDHSDGQTSHLDGLNLSRAWSMRGIASSLDRSDPVRALMKQAAQGQLDEALPFVASGHYAGEHWLATYAVLAMQ